ncbi:hypothetical protein LIER_21862 [Lithospermum erythrorhizon]|uniref:Retrotransposon Copia-like N-terminal domain-containing protein n=1 Tax=Lithospermum erythrorhizon TaxID=34254 RepID=A0AAV3QUQ1_LITER
MTNPPTIEREDTKNSSNPLPNPSISDAPPLPTPSLNLPLISPTLNVKICVPIELTYTNYLNWKKVITRFLGNKKLLPLVNGNLPQPPDDHPEFATLVQCDDLVHSWINATISLPVLETLLNHNCTSALHAWQTLNQLFLDHGQPTRMNLRSKFHTFAKGNLTIIEFLQQIHSLYCLLKVVGEPLVDSDLIAQTLIGLPSLYAPFVMVMNNTRPMPTFATLRPMLLNEEDRLNLINPLSDSSSNVVLYTSANSDSNSNQSYNKGGSFGSPSRGNNGPWGGRSQGIRGGYIRPRFNSFGPQSHRHPSMNTVGVLGAGPRAAPPFKTQK